MPGKKSSKSKTTPPRRTGGNTLTIGGKVGGNNAIIVGNQNTLNQSVNTQANEIANLFEVAYQRIEERKQDPQVDKEEITQAVQRIEQETAKGEEANPDKVDRWLKTLTGMAPDIGEVVISCLTSPAAGIAAVIRKIAEKAKAESK